ncbi:MAG: GNAT family N-acetyltransferase [Nitrospirota bacterium]|nr:GNAT family N-acetyltransferase [Nitrospirota bacterium]
MEVSVRAAKHGDIDILVNLLRELFEIEEDFIFDDEKQRRGLTLMINSKKDRIFVAEYRNEVIGMCSVQLLISTAEGSFVGLLEDMVVKKAHRGTGVGRRLITKVEQWSVEQGLTRLQLLGDRNNDPALAFYEKLGWSETKLIGLRKLPGQYTDE